MYNYSIKVTGIVLLCVMALLSQSCTTLKCETQRQSCKWDCPQTVVIKQACEEKCNISYDICRSKE